MASDGDGADDGSEAVAMCGKGRELGGADFALAGAFAGASEMVVVQPLDMLKTRLQLNPTPGAGLISTLRSVVQEGGVLALYRGLLPELLCGIPKSSVVYASYSKARQLLASATGRDDALTSFVAGASSGIPEAIVVTPFQVVKVRMQARAHMGRYRNAGHCVSTMLREEGAASLATGLSATVMRNCVWNAFYFSSFVMLSRVRGEGGGRVQTLTSGFAAGVFATCFNTPFDVIKSRMQADVGTTTLAAEASAPAAVPTATGMASAVTTTTTGMAGVVTTTTGTAGAEAGATAAAAVTAAAIRPAEAPPTGVVHRIAAIVRTEGVLALWKGFTAKSLRMGVGGAVGLWSFDIACDFLRAAAPSDA